MNRFNLIDVEGNLLLPNSYAYVRATTLDRVVFRTDEGLRGLLNGKTNQVMLEPRFSMLQPFRSEISKAGDPQTGKYGLVHAVHGPFGNWQFCRLSSFVDGFAVAWEREDERGTRDNRIGFINEAGEWAIAPVYQSAADFHDGRALVRGPERGTYGYIDRDGKLVIPMQYIHAQRFSEGLANASNEEWAGFLDVNGQRVANVGDYCWPFHHGYCCSFLTDNQGRERAQFLDLHFRPAFGQTFADVRNFSEGVASVKGGKKWGLIDLSGKLIVPFKYDSLDACGKGLIPAEMNGKAGYIKPTGEVAIPFHFKAAQSFNQWGIATVMLADE